LKDDLYRRSTTQVGKTTLALHTGQDDYEIADLRARVLPFTRFVEEVLQV